MREGNKMSKKEYVIYHPIAKYLIEKDGKFGFSMFKDYVKKFPSITASQNWANEKGLNNINYSIRPLE